MSKAVGRVDHASRGLTVLSWLQRRRLTHHSTAGVCARAQAAGLRYGIHIASD